MPKNKVIYTCLVGSYDTLLQPIVIDDSFDYICFSNDIPQHKIGVWNIRPIPFINNDPTRISRYPKILPHLVLSDYEFSLYVDANIQIATYKVYEQFNRLTESQTLIAQLYHHFRDCIYDEIKVCIGGNKDDVKLLLKLYSFLKKEGYPRHNGLYENNVIFRRHNNYLVIKASELWWKMYNQFARRDQLSLCYVYWKIGIKCSYFFPKGINTRNSTDVIYHPHTTNKSKISNLFHDIKCYRNKFILTILYPFL